MKCVWMEMVKNPHALLVLSDVYRLLSIFGSNVLAGGWCDGGVWENAVLSLNSVGVVTLLRWALGRLLLCYC